MSKTVRCIVVATALIAISGCGVKDDVKKLVGLGGDDQTVYSGPAYPPTNKIVTAFQPAQVGKSCRVFAQSLVLLPANLTGKDIENSLLTEAGQRGADQVLIGQARQSEDNHDLQFLYYGPTHEYACVDQCGGWKFGYDLWEEQGDWVSIGYGEWGKAEAQFANPLVMQLALLRCQ